MLPSRPTRHTRSRRCCWLPSRIAVAHVISPPTSPAIVIHDFPAHAPFLEQILTLRPGMAPQIRREKAILVPSQHGITLRHTLGTNPDICPLNTFPLSSYSVRDERGLLGMRCTVCSSCARPCVQTFPASGPLSGQLRVEGAAYDPRLTSCIEVGVVLST
ncbi:hypothetical protein K431DRAFT_162743 [Polychaeton citri CBS 116435]|uniref:Uncharacterized protein n=1 Tax=Polychaeton citri CBS 116435 TaxID=1314669 RepID=A0A9P4ULL1_9PEZI|nr:hypothetical protein K431DRAFT_162743 [Polychaeton citri CBS 116435]